MKHTIVVALVLLTAACGAYRFPGSQPPANGAVTGRVIAVPCAPVQSTPKTCAGRPVFSLEIDFRNATTTAATTTDSNGDYAIDLQPGTWDVSMKSYMRVVSGPRSVTVTSGSTVVANYVLDSGIRVPVPQQ